ncbi:FtsX-like permease family protein [Hydrogenimonas urashimensis]|uniref:FtsX-like permease family protein n=1 Tax=Hydrogenimonas urashimensis TaxID=2740515 RepID=UPI0019154179|nr:FtsX-like permease family protein [Hydrogenimonas urashimensis]
MTFVRNHLGLILPLFAILFAIEYMLIFDRIIKDYETRLQEQYTVIVVAEKSLDPESIKGANPLVKTVEPVDSKSVLMHIRKKISEENLKKLQTIVPAFYTLKLVRYPDKKSLDKLRRDLLNIKGIKRVQIFEKVHDRLYAMLLFMKSNFYIFGAMLGLISFLLVMKQMLIWQLEHKERMQIMALFGAPVWLRSGVLFRLAFVDALIAVLLALSGMLYLISEPRVKEALAEMGINGALLFHYDDVLYLASAGFGIALFCATWVVVRFREEL